MNIYFIQEKNQEYWFDLYSADLCQLKKMILILKEKNKDKKYRIIKVYI